MEDTDLTRIVGTFAAVGIGHEVITSEMAAEAARVELRAKFPDGSKSSRELARLDPTVQLT